MLRPIFAVNMSDANDVISATDRKLSLVQARSILLASEARVLECHDYPSLPLIEGSNAERLVFLPSLLLIPQLGSLILRHCDSQIFSNVPNC